MASHPFATDRLLRPVASDYSVFGAAVRVDWLREGGYASNGTFTSRPLDSGPGSADWTTLTSQADLPTGTAVSFETRSGATKAPDASWSPWQAVQAGGAVGSPNGRYIQYRATMRSTAASASPSLKRVQVGFGGGTDRAPTQGSVSLAPSSPRTNQTRDAQA